MAKINVLPKSVAELIAAGEVVERPASVIKELVENSIDAGAKNITVEIKGGGIQYIRVADDGCGIHREDVRTAFISHATSKISSAADLDAIFTLGFRGEALPSIAAVSKLFLLTKAADEDVGTGYTVEGGEEISLDDAGCPDGTTFIVRDLFYNTPARMKFLKRDITEGTYAADAVTRTALSHPGIKFTMIRDGKTVLSTPGGGDFYQTVYSAFGRETAEALLPCEYEYNGIKINGFISRPLNNRPNRNMQYFFVNGRNVRIPAASPALDEAYKNKIMVGKFPMCFIFAEIPADKIDVNVHPAKTEIRFSDERAIFEAVFYAARSALAKGDTLRPSINLPEKKDLLARPVPSGEQLEMSPKKPETEKPSRLNVLDGFEGSVLRDTSPRRDAPAEIKTQTENTVPAEPVKPAVSASGTYRSPVDINIIRDDGDEKNEMAKAVIPEAGEQVRRENVFTAKPAEPEKTEEKKPEAPVTQTKPEIPHKIIGEVFRTYIIVERGDKMLIIDKHAAHERMIFNSLKKKSGSEGSQLLLFPVTVQLSAGEYAAVLENTEVFSEAGYAVGDFGGSSVIVRECPVELEHEDIRDIITEMAGKLRKGELRPVPEKLDWLYHSTACRAAVKAGDELKPEETAAFVKRLLADDSVMYCPHGRPVLYELTKTELEKQFGRLG